MRNTNFYKMDMREMKFVIYEQFKMHELFQYPCFNSWNSETCNIILDQAEKFACDVAGPTFGIVEEDPPCFNPEDGTVKLNSFFEEAYRRGVTECGWQSIMVPAKHGGDGAPYTLTVAVYELLSGASPALSSFSIAAGMLANLITSYGTEEQVRLWVPRLVSGEWNGTMALTEPEAGTDVGAIRTKAVKQEDSSYLLSGTKIFISNGEHDANENIVHMVLARSEGAPGGTKGLSLFIVPKMRIDPDGNITDVHNDVTCGGIEHKMGSHGSPTCTLYFGENGNCQGFILGDGTEGIGIKQMFSMMNETGQMANAQASSAYYNALAYARERIQGAEFNQRDPGAPRVPIIKHPDIKRMLLEMKSRTEAGRSLVTKLCMHVDKAHALKEFDAESAKKHAGTVELLTPIVKAFLSDQAWRICELAIQVHGGYGYTVEYPVEQYARNVKIFPYMKEPTIFRPFYFVGRKMPMNSGENFSELIQEIKSFVLMHKNHNILSQEIEKLDEMTDLLVKTATLMIAWINPAKIHFIPATANYVLEMVSLVLCAWLLLDAAIIAHHTVSKMTDDNPDRLFYTGKLSSAIFFCRHILPRASLMADLIFTEDTSFLAIE